MLINARKLPYFLLNNLLKRNCLNHHYRTDLLPTIQVECWNDNEFSCIPRHLQRLCRPPGRMSYSMPIIYREPVDPVYKPVYKQRLCGIHGNIGCRVTFSKLLESVNTLTKAMLFTRSINEKSKKEKKKRSIHKDVTEWSDLALKFSLSACRCLIYISDN